MKKTHPVARLFSSVLLLMLCLWSPLPLCARQPEGSIRKTYNFNASWKLSSTAIGDVFAPNFDDSKWKEITLPHAWNEDEAFKKAIEDLSTGTCWYRKHFKLTRADEQKKVFLEFEGIRQAAEFYLNGKYIGRHENGVMAFGFDISGLLNAADNVLAVKIDNSWNYKEIGSGAGYQWNDKNFNANYGGISKNVKLHVMGKVYQTLPLYSSFDSLGRTQPGTGTYIYARDFNIGSRSATICAKSEIRNENPEAVTVSYEVELKDADGKTIKIFSAAPQRLEAGATATMGAEATVDKLNFWSWGYGYLYTVYTRLKMDGKLVDEVGTKTGFRKAEFKKGMVYLNDRVLMMKGYAQRSSNEWPALGLSVPPWLSDYSNGLMVEGNANLVRWMHITPWKQDVESCDRVGLIEAMPAGDAEKDVEGTRWEQRKNLMRDAMIYNRNSPSILFYECGNESISAAHMEEMKAIRDLYDPYGMRAIGSREMLDIPAAEYGGEMLYINKSADKPLWSMEYSRDEALRKYWDEYSAPYHKNGAGPLYKGADASAYNRNQDSQAIEDIIRWNEYYTERPGTGTRVSAGGVNIIFSDSNTHRRGEENYRRSGEVDAMRIPKDSYYAHQVMWDGWVDADKKGLHIIGHWNYKKGLKKDVYVVSAAAKVQLFLNGKSLGFGERSNGFLFSFKNVGWQPGLLEAVAYTQKGLKVASKKIKTAGKAVALRLNWRGNPAGFLADAADVVLVEVEVVDKDGNRCPTAMDMLNFSLEGPAEWRGGIAQGPDNYILSKTLPVECGINRVLIRSLNHAGKISLKVEAPGLQSAKLDFQSVPVKVVEGISEIFTADGLASRLGKGPTPTGASYQMSRKAIKIVGVTAGSNVDKATLSYDDNELSDWVSDGKFANAWISYELEKESTVTAVTLKLNGFRTKRYPLRILVDGKIVYSGLSETSLGYFTAICQPYKGKTVSIQLADEGITKNTAQTTVEVNGKKLDDGINHGGSNAKAVLDIIEAEIYEKP